MSLVLLFKFGVNQDVINKHHHKAVQIGVEYAVHQVHEGCKGISQFEGHHKKLIVSITSAKRSFGDIAFLHSQLFVA